MQQIFQRKKGYFTLLKRSVDHETVYGDGTFRSTVVAEGAENSSLVNVFYNVEWCVVTEFGCMYCRQRPFHRNQDHEHDIQIQFERCKVRVVGFDSEVGKMRCLKHLPVSVQVR